MLQWLCKGWDVVLKTFREFNFFRGNQTFKANISLQITVYLCGEYQGKLFFSFLFFLFLFFYFYFKNNLKLNFFLMRVTELLHDWM